MRPIKTFIKHPRLICSKILRLLSPLIKNDELYLKWLFRFEMGYWMNFDNPQTFIEKLQWLKLYNRRPEYTQMVDKYAVKEYVANIIGEEYIIPTLGVWDSVDEIDFESLPNQFVLKTTHGGGGGGVVVCKDKSKLDIQKCKKQLQQSMDSCIYRGLREWPYRDVPHRIIAEQYLADESGQLPDYKFFCFNGVVKYCQVITDRYSDMKIYFFDHNWNYLNFAGLYTERNCKIEQKNETLIKPIHYSEMLHIAKRLSENLPFVRVDLYNIKGKIYFGEITFFPASGFGFFTSDEWDSKMGDLIKLNAVRGV